MDRESGRQIALAIRDGLISRNVSDSNLEPANLVDVLAWLAKSGQAVANAITPHGVGPGRDETGGVTASLTEAVMGVTAGLCQIARSIDGLAESLRQNHEKD